MEKKTIRLDNDLDRQSLLILYRHLKGLLKIIKKMLKKLDK